MFGVMTVMRRMVRTPGVTPPSSTLQKVAGRFSSRTSHCLAVASASTMRSGSRPSPTSTPPGSFCENSGPVGEREVALLSVVGEHATARTARAASETTRMYHLLGPRVVGRQIPEWLGKDATNSGGRQDRIDGT